jgi:hypothetical protein
MATAPVVVDVDLPAGVTTSEDLEGPLYDRTNLLPPGIYPSMSEIGGVVVAQGDAFDLRSREQTEMLPGDDDRLGTSP